MTKDIEELMERLAAPFEADEVKFKAQSVTKDGARAMAVPYVSARAVMDRLDDVLGMDGWQDEYQCLGGGAVVCRLKLRINGEWITKEDVGGQSEQPDEGDRTKAAFSDALKRAAVKVGIGRYLYRQKAQWVEYDSQKRQFKVYPSAPVFTPRKTAHGHHAPANRNPNAQAARPSQPSRPAAVQPQPSQAPAAPAASPKSSAPPAHIKSVGEVVEKWDTGMLQDGLIGKPGELAGHVMDSLKGKYKGPISSWPLEAYQEVKDVMTKHRDFRIAAAQAASSMAGAEELEDSEAATAF